MRPRPEGRGELEDSLRDNVGVHGLQCGHDPKAVENSISRSFANTHRSLQCGHNPKAVENYCRDPKTFAAEYRFNAATTRRPWRTALQSAQTLTRRDASMRPRPEGRGERRRLAARRNATRSFNAATTRRPWRTTARARRARSAQTRLQCGHNPKAVENESGEHGGRRLRPEASMRPRPEGRGERFFSASWLPTSVLLQCGHDPKAVENNFRPKRSRRTESCFNAATTRRPWRTQLRQRWPLFTGRASMRPQPEGRGEHESHRQYTQAQFLLQCGHDPKAVENPARRDAQPGP